MSWFDWMRGRRATTKSASATPADAAEPRFMNAGGRRYMADAAYVLPKDDGEMNRLDFQHFMLRHTLRGNYAAPISNPRAIVDVGCGTGRWAMEMAQLFPDANVVGLDLVAPPANASSLGAGVDRRPANYTFVQGSALERLPFNDASFDFTHQRLLYSAIPAAKWPPVVAELARVTLPGGWVELVEAGAPPTGGPAMNAFHPWTVAGGQQLGLDMLAGSHIADFLRQAGLVNVALHEIPMPLGSSGGRLGTMMQTNLLAIFKAGRGMSVARGVASEAEYDDALAAWPHEVAQRQATFSYYIAYGQRAQ